MSEFQIETKRLYLKPLSAEQLRLWVEDISALQRQLGVRYEAEPMEGGFKDIVSGQVGKIEGDTLNWLFHTFWLIVRKEDRVVVGSADFKDVPNEFLEVEIGYGLGKNYEGNGYMTEAVDAMCTWALKQPNVKRVIAETQRDNAPSKRVLIRAGFRQYRAGETDWWWRA